ncbi:3-oxoacyl-[acyl-carrier-protein] reductase [Candidatus Dependentiae bacterium]|nr:3-oxoacyl-[acyl-carrier-protein] reductase [Candidatus Dependentiae bacterium]
MYYKNKFTSIVTGGLQGIGKGIVEKLKKRGDNLFIFDLVSIQDERVQKIQDLGIKYFQVDVSCVDSIKEGFNKIYQILEKKKLTLDLLINNAGITKDSLAIRMTERDWDSVLQVNLKGTFFCCQQAIKKMMRQKKGYIINISSIIAHTGNIGQANYSASKAGVIALTKSLAKEYGSRNILINAIAPGFIETDMTKKLSENIKKEILKRISLQRFGTVEDVANLICFLSSGNADYITGSIIDINGGLF